MESEKPASERRIWYNYQGQQDAVDSNGTVYPGSKSTLFSTSLVSKAGRVVGDVNGDPATDTQLAQWTYNSLGHPIQTVDPEGRVFTFVYDANQIDLLEVWNTRVGQNVRLVKLSNYYSHRPQTIESGDGNVTQLLYNNRGQVTRITNPKNEIMEFVYNSVGFLTDIKQGGTLVNGQVTGSKVVAKYTSYRGSEALVGTVTTGDGSLPGGAAYTTTFSYDNLKRVKKITHPDNTYEEFTYTLLDLEWTRDRAGRMTRVRHDYAGRPYEITDPAQRVTLLDWCGCGHLESIIDGEGRTTGFEYDINGRLTDKHFPDGQSWTFIPEIGSGRLKQKIDGRNQVTNYTYFLDDQLATISYQNPLAPT
ncbi:MAG: RHS repeat protein, partial [Verrucomicrobiaceae bacterium]